jgi:hypothetical protein
LWHIPAGGGVAQPTNLAVRAPWVGMAFSPDGRRLVYEAGRRSSEIWVMKNYLPRN